MKRTTFLRNTKTETENNEGNDTGKTKRDSKVTLTPKGRNEQD